MQLEVPPIDLIATGSFRRSNVWRKCCGDVEAAIKTVVWPPRSRAKTFILNPTPLKKPNGKLDKHPNGVTPIKNSAVAHLKTAGWTPEARPPVRDTVFNPGDIDALYVERGMYVGFEWETGNVSSSHRAINKLLLALMEGEIRGGILVVPGSTMKKLLTDRVGNIGELRPYFGLWRSLAVTNAALRIYAVKHDGVSNRVRHIPKGNDGRAVN